MEIEVQHLTLSLNIEEISEAIKNFVKTKGYIVSNDISIEDIKRITIYSKLTINAKKFSEEKNAKEKLFFPSTFFARINHLVSGLGIFTANLNKNQLQEFANNVFDTLSEKEKILLIFTYSLNNEINSGYNKAKKMKEVAKRFDLSIAPLIALNKALSFFANQLSKVLHEELSKGSLFVENNLDKDEILLIDLKKVGFSRRVINCIYPNDIKTVSDLLKFNENYFLKFRNFGNLGISEIKIFRNLYKI